MHINELSRELYYKECGCGLRRPLVHENHLRFKRRDSRAQRELLKFFV